MAESLLRQSAEAGSPEGMAELGDLFLSKSRLSARAVPWWRRAAELGHTGAIVKLGTIAR
ncbi:hypothetical protein [Streptomyces pacificus]|uniref:hypothetical protein n=1 Tax=Streptomyces pacificus TaxID=2705029 RepID=UPI001567201F|nr:hypothetical protein [Streptomyces pacificus]